MLDGACWINVMDLFDMIYIDSYSSCSKQASSKWKSLSRPTLCDLMDYTKSQTRLSDWTDLDYTIHGILQARILEWVAFPFSRGSSQLRDWTQVSLIAGGFFTHWATSEAQEYWSG